jgi:hypothetical protein
MKYLGIASAKFNQIAYSDKKKQARKPVFFADSKLLYIQRVFQHRSEFI